MCLAMMPFTDDCINVSLPRQLESEMRKDFLMRYATYGKKEKNIISVPSFIQTYPAIEFIFN